MARPPAQRHTIKFDLPEDLLATFGGDTLQGGIPKTRIAGAVAAGVGSYLLVRVFQKTAGDLLRTLAGVSGIITELLTGINPLGSFSATQEQLLALEPFALSIGLVTGGMILAGQNPGEILKGIGEIIPL